MFNCFISSFNPHSRVGSDRFLLLRGKMDDVSIHTPAWGVTASSLDIEVMSYVSIHTPAWGVTQKTNFALPAQYVSIHTPAWGVTEKA